LKQESSQPWPRLKLKPSGTGADKAKLARHRAGDRARWRLLPAGKQGQIAQWGALIVGLCRASWCS
jgi:hypothetical protein